MATRDSKRSPALLALDASRTEVAQVFNQAMRDHILAARERGMATDREIAAYLNSRGLRTLTARPWSHSTVSTLRRRLGIPTY